MTAPNAQDNFIRSIEASRILLAQLQEQLNNFLGVSPENVHWGHVGDAKFIEEKLADMIKHNRVYGIGS